MLLNSKKLVVNFFEKRLSDFGGHFDSVFSENIEDGNQLGPRGFPNLEEGIGR